MPYMYILECVDGSFYTGSTWDLERRFWEHQNGLGARHTAKRLPVRLVHCEEYDRVDEAFRREKQVQGWTHAKKLALIESNEGALHELAKCLNETVAVGFGSAQPTTVAQAQPTNNNDGRSLSHKRSVSGAEPPLMDAEGNAQQVVLS